MARKILLLTMILVFTITSFVGCGNSRKESASSREMVSGSKADTAVSVGSVQSVDGNKYADKTDAGTALNQIADTKIEKQFAETTEPTTAMDEAAKIAPNPILMQRKVIRNANVSVEVEEFDKAYGQINSILTGIGYIQETNIKKEKVYYEYGEKLLTRGVIILRVEADKFDRVLKDVKGIGILYDENIKSDDITDKFFDTEARLRVLKIEYDKMEEYLKKLNDPDIIFKTQNRLTQIRQEMESLTGTLRKWNDLISLSTITINLNEKRPGMNEGAVKEKSYFSRLTVSFTESVKGVIKLCGELLIFIVKCIPVLVVIGFLALAAMFIRKKLFKKKSKGVDSKGNDIST